MKNLLLSMVLLLPACSAREMAAEALYSAGYSEVHVGDWAWYGCGEDDQFHYQFVARNPAGRPSSGVVCCGMYKNCTIRH